MKTYSIVVCLALLALWVELPSASGQSIWKPGACPRDNRVCISNEDDLCRSDADCKGQKKCCYNACAKRCVLPVKVKPGSCPLDPTACLPGGRVLCYGDFDCPGSQKCCSYECVVQCKDPV
ncbi:WAP four-disulfide core domain protein 5-like [Eublepharis macularius]|uniref:WAP four-disulfide core domain protein 5-like n=1 Tax=Eublepharis macularius TaxID=481883 RepID=A0AA97JF48_EUBMA|nr:WAP four-disulfide core domain protein 5-like [Eublepharis macularius]